LKGLGRYDDRYGNIYQGWFINDEKEGLGRSTKISGDIFLGMYKGGQRTG